MQRAKSNKFLMLMAVIIVLIVPFIAYADTDSLDNFKRSNVYQEQFKDVGPTDWYYINVKNAFEMGLMLGSGVDRFNSSGNITIAEVIAIASRIHNIYYNGSDQFSPTAIWYQTYVDYALKNGIISANNMEYSKQASRADFASILVKSLPDSALKSINTIDEGAIPDVPASGLYADEIYKLYRAGVIIGNDKKGTFTPNTYIQRSAVAAIVTRMADTALRQNISLELVDTFSMNQKTATIYEGESLVLFVDMQTSTGEDVNVTWKTSNSEIATVNEGRVLGVKGGDATITATAPNGKTTTCEVTVAIAASSIELNKTYGDLYIGHTDQLKATVLPKNTTDKTVTWLSSDPTVAHVDNNGKVTGYGKGTVTISASTLNGLTSYCIYSVTKLYTLTSTDDRVSVVAGESDTVTIAHNNDYYTQLTYSVDDTDIASVTWGSWKDNYRIPLTITGKRTGTTYINISYTVEGKVISEEIKVVVKSPYTIFMPSLPQTIIDYLYGDIIYCSFDITDVTFVEDTSSYSFYTGTLYFKGVKTASYSSSSSIMFKWKLIDENGYTAQSGSGFANSIGVGNTFSAESRVYSLAKGRYTLEIEAY